MPAASGSPLNLRFMTNPAETSPTSTCLIPQSKSTSKPARPQFSSEEQARKLYRLLLDMSKDTSEKEAKSAYRRTADFFRESYFGLTQKAMRARIVKFLEEFFDGEIYPGLEIENIAEETGIKEETLAPVLDRMVKRKIIVVGRRRRYNEMGEHYNALYKLNK